MSDVPLIPNTMKCTLRFYQQDDSVAENVVWLTRDSAWTDDDMVAGGAALKGWWHAGDGSNSYYGNMHNLSGLTAIEVRDAAVLDGRVIQYEDGLPIAGENSDTPVPLGVTYSFTLRTGLAGRQHRGRLFAVGMFDGCFADEKDNVVDSAYQSSMVDALLSLITNADLATLGATWVVASLKIGNTYRDTALLTPITDVGFYDNFADFQRRRAPGHNRKGGKK
jgi:hypothetical protein